MDIEILVDAFKEFMSDPVRQSKDFIDFAKRGCDLTIYGEPDETDLTIAPAFLEGRGDSRIWTVPQKYSDEVRRVDCNIPYQVFFLNITNPELIFQEKQRNPFFCAYLDDYREAFTRLSESKYIRVNDPKAKAEFKVWADILPDLPITEIIITDPYILNETKTRLEENYYQLLKVLRKKYSLKSLIVFSHSVDPSKRSAIIERSIEILSKKTVFRLIGVKSDYEHDRYIFMNYSFLNSGSSLNYFDQERKVAVNKSSKIEFCPYSTPRNFEIAQEVLSSLYQEFSRMQQNGIIPGFIDSGLFCFLKKVDTSLEDKPI